MTFPRSLSMAAFFKASMGAHATRIADTAAHTGNFSAVMAINGDAVINAHDVLANGDTIREGTIVPGYTETIQLTSGVVIAYEL
jgi:hypothetical protein